MRLGKLLILAAVLGTLSMVAKEPVVNMPTDPQGKITYQEEVPIKGVNAAELYARARTWVWQTYVDSEDEIKMDDKANGPLVVIGHSSLPILGKVAMLQHTLTIEPKDGQYRVTLTGLALDPTLIGLALNLEKGGTISLERYVNAGGRPQTGAAELLVEADKACHDTLANLAAAMHKRLPAEKKKPKK